MLQTKKYVNGLIWIHPPYFKSPLDHIKKIIHITLIKEIIYNVKKNYLYN